MKSTTMTSSSTRQAIDMSGINMSLDDLFIQLSFDNYSMTPCMEPG